MSDDRWQRIEEIFQQAADLPGVERARFLAAACAGDDGMRREVESLLAHDQSPSDVLVAAISDAASEQSDSRPIPDFVGKQIGPYRILSLLGRGGMGAVYKARDSRLERDVAIKLLPEALIEGTLRVRFEREARAASALNHPNICSVYDVGEFEENARTYRKCPGVRGHGGAWTASLVTFTAKSGVRGALLPGCSGNISTHLFDASFAGV